jgi:hypothetical protein
MKSAGAGGDPQLFQDPLLVDDHAAAVVERERQDVAVRFEIDIGIGGLDRFLDAPQGVGGFLIEFAVVHG